ncbi:Ig-like domain repeat protein [Microbacterium sp. 2FI]|uniref:Ig-like domain repeat protein n=1 Tax=Microbacterium sp. 2FI TaxID=2502193 RepID=UPI0014859109|nr:Ig-like domain repeat protein [Microbacterium sp. 2FI]
MTTIRRRAWIAAVLAAITAASTVGFASTATAAEPTAEELSPDIVHTGTGPTGYEVTFHFYDPLATSIRIKGEWSFASAGDIAADPTNPSPRFGSTWLPGDIPIPSPLAGSAGNWPVSSMVKDEATGIWSYTTPLPSGVFSYWLYRDCTAAAPAMTGCTALYDPSNPPWSTAGTIERTSQVYVPSDPAFGTADYSWQAPSPESAQGALEHITFPFPGHTNPANANYATVYTPPGYDPDRAVPYPTYYLNHGGGGNEMNWSTQGVVASIVDNLIAADEIEPLVIVMPNNPTRPEITDYLVPYIEGAFNVSSAASDRALSGLSGGGTVVQDILFNDTTQFGYYGVWSVPRGLPTAGQENSPALKELLGLHIGVGIQDLGGLAQGNTTAEQALLTSVGVPFTSYNVDGAHTWSYWRDALRDFLTRVAFKATSVEVENHGRAVTAAVTSDTGHVTAPSGSVQFALDGVAIGAPQPVRNGVARVAIPAKYGTGEVTAVYTGDTLFNTSTGAGAL